MNGVHLEVPAEVLDLVAGVDEVEADTFEEVQSIGLPADLEHEDVP